MKKHLLIFISLFFINTSYTMETERIGLLVEVEKDEEFSNKIIDSKKYIEGEKNSFSSFFTDPKLQQQANLVLDEKEKYSSSNNNNFIILCVSPKDVLKKIIFDYLVNTNPEITDEKEIYKNFKKLALTCKFFANLSKPIMAQIVLISDKEIKTRLSKESLLLEHSQKVPLTRNCKIKFGNIFIGNCEILTAVNYNKALWIIHNSTKIKRKYENLDYDVVEMCFIVATTRNNFASIKLLLDWESKNQESYYENQKEKTWKLSSGYTPMHFIFKNFKDYEISTIELFLKNKHIINHPTDTHVYPVDFLFWEATSKDEEKIKDIITLLLKYGLNSSLFESLSTLINKRSNQIKFPKIKSLLDEYTVNQNTCNICEVM